MEFASEPKVARAKQLFESPEWYLGGTGFNIRIRQETVRDVVGSARFGNILDVGCGNGAISVPLLRADNRLTLVDVSSRMIEIARASVPAELQGNVKTLNADLTAAPLEAHSYDLIICLGVLAHVPSPAATVEQLATLLRPDGTLILEFTDAHHPIGRLNVFYHKLRNRVKGKGYKIDLNLLSHRDVFGMLDKSHLRTVSTFRYGMWFPLVHKFFSQQSLYKLIRAVYGTAEKNRNGFLGNAYVCVVKANPEK